MSRIVVCPKCHQPTTAPKKGGPKSVVRCPLCKEQFKLRDVRDFTPPKLLVIAGVVDDAPAVEEDLPGFADELPGLADIPEEFEAAAATPAVEAESELPPSVVETVSGPPEEPAAAEIAAEATVDDWLPPAAVTTPAAGAPAASGSSGEKPEDVSFDDAFVPRPRARRAAANPLRELVKIVLGGVVGLCVGYAILIWGFRVDPFGLTKVMPPAILPAALQER